MNCPKCGGKVKVADSRTEDTDVIRRRVCTNCSMDWVSIEIMMDYEEGREEMARIHTKIDRMYRERRKADE